MSTDIQDVKQTRDELRDMLLTGAKAFAGTVKMSAEELTRMELFCLERANNMAEQLRDRVLVQQ